MIVLSVINFCIRLSIVNFVQGQLQNQIFNPALFNQQQQQQQIGGFNPNTFGNQGFNPNLIPPNQAINPNLIGVNQQANTNPALFSNQGINPNILPVDPNFSNLNFQTCPVSVFQSKTDINRFQLIYDQDADPVKFINYNNPVQTSLSNTGRNIRLNVLNRGPQISVNLNSYNLQDMTLQWSPTDNLGSQHSFNGQTFPLELQMVHIRDPLPLGTNNVVLSAPNTVVVSILYDWIVEPNEYVFENKELNKILAYFQQLDIQGRTIQMSEPVIPLNLFPSDYESYVRYTGVATTPPCSDNVDYVVMTHVLNVSRIQMQQFRRITIAPQPRQTFVAGASLVNLPQQNLGLFQDAQGRIMKLRNDLGYLNKSNSLFVNTVRILFLCILFTLYHITHMYEFY